MQKYELLIFDADHTVIDFDADERRAFYAAFRAVGREPTADEIEACWVFSAKNWNDLGLNEVHDPLVQQNYHSLYHEHVRCLMTHVDKMYDLNSRVELAKEVFERELSAPSHYIEQADELIESLSKTYRVAIATNGLSQMQRGRLSKVTPYLSGLFISEEMGKIKPHRDYFEEILEKMQVFPQNALMIGDSLSSDIVGANGANIPCVWFNRRGATLPVGYKVEKVITSLVQLKEIL